MDNFEKLIGGCALIVAGIAGAILIGFFVLAACNPHTTHAAPLASLVAKQFDNSSCTLAAVATHMNYRSGQPDYSAHSMALAYVAKYGTSDWFKDGNTSHQAQDLVRYAGFTPVYARLTDAPDPVGLMKWLAYAGSYPVVFLAGNPEHAIVLVSAYVGTITIADPFDGSISAVNAYDLFNRLDSEKWYFTTL